MSESKWTISVVKGDELRRLIATQVGRKDVERCLWFVRENASADEISEDELARLIDQFDDTEEASPLRERTWRRCPFSSSGCRRDW